jgi:hypothetical protein
MKWVWLIWMLAMNPLGSAEMNIFYIGVPLYNKPCSYNVEDIKCDPVVLTKERVRRK